MQRRDHLRLVGEEYFSGECKENEITWKQLVIVDIIVTYFNAISPERRMKEIGTSEPFEYTAGNNSHDCYYWIKKWHKQVPANLETRILKIIDRKKPTREERLRIREIKNTINRDPKSEKASVYRTYPRVPKPPKQVSKKKQNQQKGNNPQMNNQKKEDTRKDVSQFEDGEYMDKKKFKKYVKSIPEIPSEDVNIENVKSESPVITERKIKKIEDNVLRQLLASPVMSSLNLAYVNTFIENVRAKDIIVEFVAQDEQYKSYAIKVYFDRNYYEDFVLKRLHNNKSWKHKILDPKIAKEYPNSYEGMYTRPINEFEKVCVIVNIEKQYIQFLVQELVERKDVPNG